MLLSRESGRKNLDLELQPGGGAENSITDKDSEQVLLGSLLPIRTVGSQDSFGRVAEMEKGKKSGGGGRKEKLNFRS